MSGTTRQYISAQSLLEDSWALGQQLLSGDWRPQLLIGLWRGGAPIAIALHEYLLFHDQSLQHQPLKTEYYTGVDRRAMTGVRITGSDSLTTAVAAATRILLVDDVFDTGRTVQAVLAELGAVPGPQRDIRVAAPWFKPARNQTTLQPDYFLHTTEDWLVFPHELCGLPRDELSEKKVGLLQHLSDP